MHQEAYLRLISSYAGESASDYLANYEELHERGMYNQSLILDMVLTVMDANDCNEDCCSRIDIKRGLNAQQLKICHKGYEEAHKLMAQEGLNIWSVLTKPDWLTCQELHICRAASGKCIDL